jgi:hypothetical protein
LQGQLGALLGDGAHQRIMGGQGCAPGVGQGGDQAVVEGWVGFFNTFGQGVFV